MNKENKKNFDPANIVSFILFLFLLYVIYTFLNSQTDLPKQTESENVNIQEDLNKNPSESQNTTKGDGLWVGTQAVAHSGFGFIYCTDTKDNLDTVISAAINNPNSDSLQQNFIQNGKLTLIFDGTEVLIIERAYQKRRINATDATGSNVDCWTIKEYLKK